MYQPKIKHTQEYSDSQGECIVAPAKLILIDLGLCRPKKGDIILHKSNKDKPKYTTRCTGFNSQETAMRTPNGQTPYEEAWLVWRPILISETEEISKGDRVLCETELGYQLGTCKGDTKSHATASSQYVCSTSSGTGLYYFGSCHKILALSEHLSDKHIQDFVDGNIKNGDEVLVKCQQYSRNIVSGGLIPPGEVGGKGLQSHKEEWSIIHLDQHNHITLFPIENSEYIYVLECREVTIQIESLWCVVSKDVNKLISFINKHNDFIPQHDKWWWVILKGKFDEASNWQIHSIYTNKGLKVENQPIPDNQLLDEKIEEVCENFIGQYQRNMFEASVFKPILKNALREMVKWAKKNNN